MFSEAGRGEKEQRKFGERKGVGVEMALLATCRTEMSHCDDKDSSQGVASFSGSSLLMRDSVLPV